MDLLDAESTRAVMYAGEDNGSKWSVNYHAECVKAVSQKPIKKLRNGREVDVDGSTKVEKDKVGNMTAGSNKSMLKKLP